MQCGRGLSCKLCSPNDLVSALDLTDLAPCRCHESVLLPLLDQRAKPCRGAVPEIQVELIRPFGTERLLGIAVVVLSQKRALTAGVPAAIDRRPDDRVRG